MIVLTVRTHIYTVMQFNKHVFIIRAVVFNYSIYCLSIIGPNWERCSVGLWISERDDSIKIYAIDRASLQPTAADDIANPILYSDYWIS